jgi:flagellar basal-body rod protein FlgG
MMRGLYTAASGMMAQQLNMDTISNNLANVNTTGFKKGRVNFQDLMYSNLNESGANNPTGAQIGMGVREVGTEKSFSQGSMSQTNDPFDLAIQGNGFFEVIQPDGSKAFTRDGSFSVNPQGQLVTSTGDLVGVTIPPGATDIKMDKDGAVTAVLSGQKDPVQIGNLMLVDFVNPQGLKAIGANKYQATNASGPAQKGKPGENNMGSIAQGYLEKSNINVVEEMISIIEAQRAYEINQKGVQSADQMQKLANQLKK